MGIVRLKVVWLLRLLIVGSIIGPALIFVAAAWQTRQDVLTAGTRRAVTTAATLHEQAARVFETQELMLDEADALISGLTWSQIGQSSELHRALAAIVKDRPQVMAIWLIGPDGVPRNSSIGFPLGPLNASDRDYFKMQRDHDAGVFVSSVYPGKVSGLPLFNVTRRRSSPSGAFDGVLVASVGQNYFATFWRSVSADTRHVVALVRADGEVLAAEPSVARVTGRFDADAPLMQRIAAGIDHGTFTAVSPHTGAPRIYAFSRLNPYGLYVVVALDEASVLEPWHNEVARFAAYAVAASSCLLALAALAWYGTRREAAAHRLGGMLDQAAVGIGQVGLDGRLLAVNDKLCRILGYPREELLRRTILEITHPDDRAAEAALVARLVARAIPVYTIEKRYLRRDGEPVWVRVTSSLASDDGATGACRVSIVEDITERKAAERALGDAERRLRVTVDRAPVGIAEIDLDGRYLRVNETFCQIRHASPESVLATTFMDVTHPDDLAGELVLWERLKRGEIASYSIEKQFRTDDGEWHWTAITCAIVRAGDGAALYGIRIAEDIDERKRALEQLRDSEFRLSLAKGAAGIGIWDYDIATGRIIWSKESYALYGVPVGQDVTSALWLSRVHPDDLARLRAELALARAGRTALEVEFRVVHPDGTIRWLSARARPIIDASGARVVRVIGADMDITQRKAFTSELERRVTERTLALERALEQLRVSEARYSTFFENAPYDMFVIDVRADGFVYEQVNPHAGTAMGIAPDAFAGQTPEQIYPPQTAAFLTEQYRTCAATGRKREFDVSYAASAGPTMRHGILVPLRYRDGKVEKLFCTSIDLTELRRVEDALRQAQKMEAIGHLTGGVAHDFNNLLTVITGNLTLLEARVTGAAAKRLIAAAQRGADRGARLTQSLLAFARKQALRPERVNVNLLIKEFIPVLKGATGDAIELQLLLSPTLHPCRVDPAQFQAAILNLVRNAGDAIVSGGRISIETENLEAVPFDGHDGEVATGAYVRITVADTGSGMTAAVLDRAFEPFFTTKEVGKGSGLGLSQVYGFVNQSDGHVRIGSELGVGTTVRILLPCARDGSEAVLHAEDAPPVAGSANAERILVVDDDPDVLSVIDETLRGLGYRVVTAADGIAALGVLERGDPVDLVVTDYSMPNGVTGRELARRAAVLRPGLQTLIISGYAMASEAAGHDDGAWLHKPYRCDELAGAVRQLLDERPAAG